MSQLNKGAMSSPVIGSKPSLSESPSSLDPSPAKNSPCLSDFIFSSAVVSSCDCSGCTPVSKDDTISSSSAYSRQHHDWFLMCFAGVNPHTSEHITPQNHKNGINKKGGKENNIFNYAGTFPHILLRFDQSFFVKWLILIIFHCFSHRGPTASTI